MRIDSNNLDRKLTKEEILAINQAASFLGQEFDKVVFGCRIQPLNEDNSQIYGLSFSFKLKDGGKK